MADDSKKKLRELRDRLRDKAKKKLKEPKENEGDLGNLVFSAITGAMIADMARAAGARAVAGDGESETESDTVHVIPMQGLETCFRCHERPSVILFVHGGRGHQTSCLQCATQEEKETFVVCLQVIEAEDDEGEPSPH